MMDFLSEEIRTQYHLLPADVQAEIQLFTLRLNIKGYTVKLDYADQPIPGGLEISVRIAKQSNVEDISN